MRKILQNLYYRIGIHTAEPGTLFYYLNSVARALSGKRWYVEDYQGYRSGEQFFKSQDAIQREIESRDVLLAFRITGGIGDHLVAARYIRDLLKATGGDFKFDIFSPRPATAHWIFKVFPRYNASYDEYHTWKQIFKCYPAAFEVSQFVVVLSQYAEWWTIATKAPALQKICEFIEKFSVKIESFISHHPCMDGFLGQKIHFMNMNRSNFLQGMSNISYGGDALAIAYSADALTKFALAGKKYITVHNGFDTEFVLNGQTVATTSTKCYPYFAELVAELRARFSDLFVVQIGTTTSTPVAGVDLNLVNKTTLEDTAAIIGGSLLHLDNESGLVHMARCLDVKSCVIFGPTSVDYFSYESNINIRPKFCGNCWWVTKDWMVACPRGFGEPRCLTLQPALGVADEIAPHLAEFLARAPNEPDALRTLEAARLRG